MQTSSHGHSKKHTFDQVYINDKPRYMTMLRAGFDTVVVKTLFETIETRFERIT